MQVANDAQIRELLIPFVLDEHGGSDTLVIQEFALYGGANRADLAALNGISHGYEIKSDKDTLARLPQQVSAYSAVFERATLVSTIRHLRSAMEIIPDWWGVVEVRQPSREGLRLERVRDCQANPAPESSAVASLLWRAEALQILTTHGLDAGVKSKSMDHLVARLAQQIAPEKLSRLVREALRARGDWRAAAQLKQYDGKSRQLSSQLGYRRTPYGSTGR
jgi:hypothetical protein